MKILLIKPSALGDVTHALPVLRLLRRRFPEAHIAWLVAPYCAGLLEGNPDLSEVILFDRKRFGSAWRSPAVARELLRFHRALRERRFDLVVDLQGLFRSGWMAWATRAGQRIGFANARELAPMFYTQRVPVPTEEVHAVDRYLSVAAALGCEAGPVEFVLPDREEDRAYVDGLLPSDPVAVLMPGTNWPTKRWPAESFGALVEPLRQRFGMASVVAGGPDAAELAGRIPGAINLAGRTSLPQLVALLRRAKLVVANDSGPMHIAAALGRPLVAIFGPTSEVRTGPYRRPGTVVRVALDCAPCFSRSCGHHTCMRRLGLEAVLGAAEAQLEAREARGCDAPAAGRPT